MRAGGAAPVAAVVATGKPSPSKSSSSSSIELRGALPSLRREMREERRSRGRGRKEPLGTAVPCLRRFAVAVVRSADERERVHGGERQFVRRGRELALPIHAIMLLAIMSH